MKDRKKFHEEVGNENQKMEQTIQQTDRQLVRIRLDHLDVKSSLTGFKDEVEVLKNQLSACETEKVNTKNQHTQLQRSLEQRKAKYEQLHQQFQGHQRGLEDAITMTKDKDQRSKDAETARAEMLQNQKSVEKEMKVAKENL
eukprot:CAMPEP_0197914562 /NCGR_PEP_ID=MMETSP1439-20131203/78724_1 /TAXON_ID=66791 /ORGANISM="Gonyaulax spinifera, Strain CCMP409" /LENGTH=141 /DNA_ID=CAMNT_0043536475 /DNA_START=9 /DNA_END=430 /DNA_ORIENTATION=-